MLQDLKPVKNPKHHCIQNKRIQDILLKQIRTNSKEEEEAIKSNSSAVVDLSGAETKACNRSEL